MKRREAIKYVATLLGGTLSAPTLLAMEKWGMPATLSPFSTGFNLTSIEKQLVAEVAEMISAFPQLGY